MHTIKGKRAFACALAAVVLMGVYGWVQNSVLFPRFAEFFPIGREIDTAARAVLYIGVAVVASKRPDLLDAKTIAAVSVVATASATALLYASVVLQSIAMAAAGVLFFELGHIWTVVFYGLAICLLPTSRHTALAAAFGIAASDLIEQLIGVLSLEAGLAAMAALPLAALALSWAPASEFMTRMQHASTPSDLEISHPRAFLRPTNALFACILVFSIASGYALTFNEVGNAPNTSPIEWAVLFAVAVTIALTHKPGGEDALFSFSVLLVIAGFLAVPFAFGNDTAADNALLRIGRNCFDILLWMTVAAIGKQNPFALMIALGLANAVRALGTIAGAVAGHTVNDVVPLGGQEAQAITACALFVFVAFLWLGFRGFSFERTINAVETPCITAREENHEESFEDKCMAIGKAHGLTERENEIFLCMARGRNVGFIQEHFVISRNTVKTHVKRIYKKLDVHSQQELIDLAESGENDRNRHEAAQ